MFLLEKKTRSSRAISSSPEEACWIGKGSCDGNSKGSDGFPNEKRQKFSLSEETVKFVRKLSKASLKLNQQDKSSKDTPLTKIIKPKIRERVKQMTLARKQLQELVDEGANDTTMQDCIKQANIWIDGITHENTPQKGKKDGKLGVKRKQTKDMTSAGKFRKLLKYMISVDFGTVLEGL